MFATNLVEAVKSIPFAVSCSQDGFIRERAGSAFAKLPEPDRDGCCLKKRRETLYPEVPLRRNFLRQERYLSCRQDIRAADCTVPV